MFSREMMPEPWSLWLWEASWLDREAILWRRLSLLRKQGEGWGGREGGAGGEGGGGGGGVGGGGGRVPAPSVSRGGCWSPHTAGGG